MLTLAWILVVLTGGINVWLARTNLTRLKALRGARPPDAVIKQLAAKSLGLQERPDLVDAWMVHHHLSEALGNIPDYPTTDAIVGPMREVSKRYSDVLHDLIVLEKLKDSEANAALKKMKEMAG